MEVEYETINSQEDFAAVRQLLREYGIDRFRADMEAKGVFTPDGHVAIPGNYFAKVINDRIVTDGDIFVPNRADNDEHWESTDPVWIGKASMSRIHKFMLPKDLSWDTFNILTLGIEDDIASKQYAVDLLNYMEQKSLEYAYDQLGMRPHQVGLFFHCYPTNSINALHLHIVDMTHLGPTWDALSYKNLSLNDAREVIVREF